MSASRFVPLLIGIAVVLFGLYLVSSHGTLGGVYLPSLIGFPNCNTNPNASQCAAFTYAGYGVGTIVVLFGLGLTMRSVRYATAPSQASLSAGPTGTTPAAPSISATNSAGTGPIRYCSRCGRANAEDASFCQRCGAKMPPPG